MISRSIAIIFLQAILVLPNLKASSPPYHNFPYTHHLNAYFQTTESLDIIDLQGGMSSAKNYKIRDNCRDQEYVLRILSPSTSKENKQEEINAASCAGELGIGPDIHYISPEHDAMIMDFISGQTLSLEHLEDKKSLPLLLNTIRKLHEFQGDFPQRKNFFDSIKQKMEKFSENTTPISWDRMKQIQKKLKVIEDKFINQPLVPCHNDLNALNIIKEEAGFKLIDWTDSCLSYAYADLGFFALLNQIGDEQHGHFLSLYLDRFPSSQELDLLKWAKKSAMLRLFAYIFSALEHPIADEKKRMQRQNEFEEILNDPLLPQLDYFIDLQRRGLLNDKDAMIPVCLSALRSFLNSFDELQNPL